MSTRIYVAIGAIATAVILATGFAVLSSDSRSEQAATFPPLPQVEAIGQDVSPPDPDATGAIVVSSQSGISAYRPDGRVISGDATRLMQNLQPGLSADGRWQAIRTCSAGGSCRLYIGAARSSAEPREVKLSTAVVNAIWSPAGARLAVEQEGGTLSLFDAASAKLTTVASNTAGWLWSGANLNYLTSDNAGSTFWSSDGKTARRLADSSSPVTRFYASPSAASLAFVCSAHDGWTLSSLDLVSGAITDFGHLGAVTEKASLSKDPPEIAISWSPDEKQIAISPVSSPYVLHLLAADGSAQKRYFFDEGYAGELKWAPNDGLLAVSTYSPDRSRHEVYVLDTTGADAPRHLLDGCHIEWAPDGRFMAVKREPSKAKGVSAIRISDGANWPVAAYTGSVPISWGVDETNAMAIAMRPINPSAVLAK